MRSRLVLIAVVLAAVPATVSAQDTGLKPGQYIPGPFHSYVVTGPHAGRLHCLVCASGLDPTVLIFTRDTPAPDGPLGLFLKQLDGLIGKYPAVRTGAFVVVLSDDASVKEFEKRQALAAKVADVAKALATPRIVFALDTAAGPPGYNLEAGTNDVVVLYHRHKVLASHTYGSERLPADDVSKLVKEVETTLAEIDRQIRPQRPARSKPAAK